MVATAPYSDLDSLTYYTSDGCVKQKRNTKQ